MSTTCVSTTCVSTTRVSTVCAGASGPAGSKSRAVPPPAGSGRVHAAGSRRGGGGAWCHPDPAEPEPAAEQVGQSQLQDGRPTGESFFSDLPSGFFLIYFIFSIYKIYFIFFLQPLELHTNMFFKTDRQSWMRLLPWQQVSRRLCRTPLTG